MGSPLRIGCVLSAIVCTFFGSALSTATAADLPPQTRSGSLATSTDLASWIDGELAVHFERSGAAQPRLVDDATFLRRVYLDLLGTIPAVSEVRDFLDDQTDNKRARLVERVLEDPRAAAHLARTWRRMLLPDAPPQGAMNGSLEAWLQEQFAQDVPYDKVVRDLVTAGGAEQAIEEDADDDDADDGDEDEDEDDEAPAASPAVEYLRGTGGDPASVAGSVSRVFLGVRMHCAQCHDHPFADWTQRDFWGLAAFFAGARYNRPTLPNQDGADQPITDEPVSTISPPDIGQTFQAGFLWDGGDIPAEVPEGELPRRVFADWLTSADNPHFAATAVNRTWQQLCGHGLTDSVDDLDLAGAAERAILLDQLARHFAAADFDLKWLIGGICQSRAYQFAADEPVAAAGLVGMRPLKVLSPEQVFDALEVALALPISRIDEGPRYNGQRDQMISRLGEATSQSPEEFRGGIPQMLMLMNGTLTADATSLETSRTLRAVVEAPFLDEDEKIETLFLAALTRPPEPAEARQLKEHLEDSARRGQEGRAYAEIMWALINSPEFMLIR